MAPAVARARTWARGIGGGASVVPLLLLFGLNAVDELDRAAFGVLLPNIREHFGLSLTGVTALTAAVIPASLIFGVPLALYADRNRRIPMVVVGALAWSVFSFTTGLSTSVLMLGLMRVGAGLGKAVNDPAHGSLLSDYYGPHARAKVFAVHRGANTVGAFAGALIAGFVADAFGWRVPFIAFAFPTLALVVLTLIFLREPERTGQRMYEGMGMPRFLEAFRILWRVGTMRRLWLAFPFLSFTAIGLAPLTSLYYSDVFDVSASGRGAIGAFDSPFIILGLVIGAPLIDRGIITDPGRVMRRVGVAASAIGVLIAGMAVAPVLPMAIACQYGVIALAAVLLAGGTAVVSLVTPPEVRAFAFSFFNISSLLGVVALPIVGMIGDKVGIRFGMLTLTPFLFIGAAIVASSGRFATGDVAAVNAPRPASAEPVER